MVKQKFYNCKQVKEWMNYSFKKMSDLFEKKKSRIKVFKFFLSNIFPFSLYESKISIHMPFIALKLTSTRIAYTLIATSIRN
jgi:hypothetical protein